MSTKHLNTLSVTNMSSGVRATVTSAISGQSFLAPASLLPSPAHASDVRTNFTLDNSARFAELSVAKSSQRGFFSGSPVLVCQKQMERPLSSRCSYLVSGKHSPDTARINRRNSKVENRTGCRARGSDDSIESRHASGGVPWCSLRARIAGRGCRAVNGSLWNHREHGKFAVYQSSPRSLKKLLHEEGVATFRPSAPCRLAAI